MSQSSSNNPVDLKKIAGTSTSVNAGNADAGTQRVVLATNQSVIPISDNGGSLTVDGTVGISGTVPVSGTFWQATQPVSLSTLPVLPAGDNNIGNVDVVSLPGTVASDITAIKTAVEILDNTVSGNELQVDVITSALPTGAATSAKQDTMITALQLLDDTVATDGSAALTKGIQIAGTDGTNAQIISTNASGHVNIADGGNSITVDGTVGISGTVPVSGTFWQTTQPVSIAAAVAVTDNAGSLTVDAPVGTPVFVRLSDGTNAITALPITDNNGSITVDGTVSVNALPAGTNNIGNVDIASLPGTVASDITAIKTAVEILDNTVSGNELQVDVITSALPTGAATSAKQDTIITALQLIDDAVGVDGAAVATGMLRVGGTDGTNNQTISVTSTGAVNIADNGSTISIDDGGGSITVDGTVAVTGTFWQATQPVSGTVTANQGTANTAANAWFVKNTDGTNTAAVKAASAAAVATDPAMVVAVSPNNSVTVTQATAANLNATVTGTVELGATSLAALENISVTIPGTVDLGTVSLTALETITVTQSTASNFLNKPYGSVTTNAPSYTNGTDNALSLTTTGALRTSITEALPSGTNVIGKLAANDGVDIGDVTINNTSIAVTDNNSSLTVDAPVATPVFVRLSNGTSAVDTIPVSGTFWQATQPVSLASVPTHAVTQSGTWTVGLSAGTNNIGDVDVVSLPALPAGTNNIGTVEIGATSLAALETISAAQSGTWTVGLSAGTNNIGDVDVASLPGTVASDITAIKTAVEILDNTVSGSELQVDIVASLPAGTNAIGKLAANAGVIIGAVELAPATTNAPSNATTTAYASSLVVKASAGTLYSITGYNSKTSTQFIQIHDSATVPADAAVPKVIFMVPPSSNFSFDLTPFGRSFANGIVICNSSTGPTKTIGSADCWIDAQYK